MDRHARESAYKSRRPILGSRSHRDRRRGGEDPLRPGKEVLDLPRTGARIASLSRARRPRRRNREGALFTLLCLLPAWGRRLTQHRHRQAEEHEKIREVREEPLDCWEGESESELVSEGGGECGYSFSAGAVSPSSAGARSAGGGGREEGALWVDGEVELWVCSGWRWCWC
ncbi:hypothetical protein DACRYDRAFT_24672 [Dacryopinax primogenitus]|uniref:Uncharacterized protein n=1 Tax=Dacryopinax primogenitus (strain DJM 731) TaxID=1858805 RepID=M5FRB6_DACPD|nr:uncharacterized protein DACRYDRAFT_24672 [Dacryopinax primogenitus]EJT98173.1 hypothetical protein DACRYDRAFT_24672 [Dacryopinax primogenitus]